MTMLRRCCALLMPLFVSVPLPACGSGLPPRSASLDPSNPNGPESPPSTLWAATDSARPGHGGSAPGSEHEHAGHDHSAGNTSATMSSAPSAPAQGASSDSSATYTCPMHPEVTSSQPGKCPKCGMRLVPKKADK